MNIFMTSRRGGPGVTTLNIITALVTAKKFDKKVCIVDLNMKQDYATLFRLDQRKNIDHLITDLGVDEKFIKLNDYIYDYDKISIILGTKLTLQTYLYKRSQQIKDLLQKLNEVYDLVFCDINGGMLYNDLVKIGVTFYPINVIEQNMLSVTEYRKTMKDGNLKGAIVINKLDNSVYPDQSVFSKAFPGNKLFLLPYTKGMRNFLNLTIRNKGVVPLKDLTIDKPFYMEIIHLCSSINDLSDKDIEKAKEEIDTDFSILDELSDRPKRLASPRKERKQSKFKFLSFFGGGR